MSMDSAPVSFETQSLLAWPPGLPYPVEPQNTPQSPLPSSQKPGHGQLPSSPEPGCLPPGLCEPEDAGQNSHFLPPEVEQFPSSCNEPEPEGNEPPATLPSLGADVHPDGCI